MNPYSKVRDLMQLNSQAQGSHHQFSWLWCLLTMLGNAEDANPTANTHNNPFREVMHRVEVACGESSFPAQHVRRMLSYRADQYGVA